jgi:poly-gamma-glutamate capsule biosynthesis protein CapA/YwtB (metallophosphatase superfamily)
LLGDASLGRGVFPMASSLAYLTPDLSGADLALANLESPLTRGGDRLVVPTAGYDLCASSLYADLLTAWGLDLLSLANNHRDDCAPNGVTQTQSALAAAGLTGIGSGAEPVVRQINGLRLAFFAFDDVSSPLDVDAAVRAIRSARADGMLVIVSVHWGMEYQGGASDRQKSLARQFAQAGAALVWGHHPHVLQPAEWIYPPAGSEPAGGSTLVLYSLGNALFDQGGLADTRQSALVLVTLDADGVKKVEAVPFEIDVVHSLLVAPDEETAEGILEKLHVR